MNLFLPPYGKRHIIILASLTFFLAMSIMFLWKSQPHDRAVKPTPTTIQAQDLRNNQDLTAPFTMAQLGGQSTAWGDSQFVLYDVRSSQEFDTSNLEGAISVPIDWLDRTAISPQATVVVYSNSIEQLDKAKTILQAKSVTAVYTLNDPLPDLAQRGFIVYEP